MFFPFMFALAPLYLFLMFKFEYLFLRKVRRKPLDTVNNDVRPRAPSIALGDRRVHHGVSRALVGGNTSRARLVPLQLAPALELRV